MTNPTTKIARALKGVDFPCSRDSLLEHARRNFAAGTTLDVLSSMPQRNYRSMAEVMDGIRQAEEEPATDTASPPPEPEDFYEEVRDPPPLAMPAPEPHATEVMMVPWLWPWNFTLQYWQGLCRLSELWWPPRDESRDRQ